MTPETIYLILSVVGPLVGLVVKHRWPDVIPFLAAHTAEEKAILDAFRQKKADDQKAQGHAILQDLAAWVASRQPAPTKAP